MAYSFFEHTADVGVECRAPTFKRLLKEAAQAMYETALLETEDCAAFEQTINITGESYDEVLVRWLQELLFLLDTQHFVATQFDIHRHETKPFVYSGKLKGYSHKPDARAVEIKAATYHEAGVKFENDVWVGRIIFDL